MRVFFESVVNESEKFFGGAFVTEIMLAALAAAILITFVAVLIATAAGGKTPSSNEKLLARMQGNKLKVSIYSHIAAFFTLAALAVGAIDYLGKGRVFTDVRALIIFGLAILFVSEMLRLVLFITATAKNSRLAAKKRLFDALKEKNVKSAKTAIEEAKAYAPIRYRENLIGNFNPERYCGGPVKEEREENVSKMKVLLNKIKELPLSDTDEALAKKYSAVVDEEKNNIDCNLPSEKNRINDAIGGLLKIMAKYGEERAPENV